MNATNECNEISSLEQFDEKNETDSVACDETDQEIIASNENLDEAILVCVDLMSSTNF